jgi:hypothetical protein
MRKESIESVLSEGKHKDGCTCGFCKNKGNIASFRKGSKKAEEEKSDSSAKPTAESIVSTLLDN